MNSNSTTAQVLKALCARRARLTSCRMLQWAPRNRFWNERLRDRVHKLKAGRVLKAQMIRGPGWIMEDFETATSYEWPQEYGGKQVVTKLWFGPHPGERRDLQYPDVWEMLEIANQWTWQRTTLDGTPCILFTSSLAKNDHARAWFEEQYGLCLRVERNGQLSRIRKYEQINSVPDSQFALPPGVPVVGA